MIRKTVNSQKAFVSTGGYIRVFLYTLLFVIVFSEQVIAAMAIATTETVDVGAATINEFSFNTKQKIEAVIGAGQLNRIQINGGQLIEVVGDESKYTIQRSSDWQNLFIAPKVEVGETVEISLVLAGNLVQDIRFTVGDVTAQTIFINVGGPNSRSNKPGVLSANTLAGSVDTIHCDILKDNILKAEISQMIRAMIEDIKDKYYVTKNIRVIPNNNAMRILQLKAYRYQDLSGAVLEVKNNSRNVIELREQDFKGFFKGVVAINIGNTQLVPRSYSKVFIVTKDVPNN